MCQIPPVPADRRTIVHLCGNCKGTTEEPSIYVLPQALDRPSYGIVVCPSCRDTLGAQKP